MQFGNISLRNDQDHRAFAVASAVGEPELLVESRAAQHGSSVERGSGRLQDGRSQTGRHQLLTEAERAELPLLTGAARFAHDAVDAEGAFGLRDGLGGLGVCSGVRLRARLFGPAGVCRSVLSLRLEVVVVWVGMMIW